MRPRRRFTTITALGLILAAAGGRGAYGQFVGGQAPGVFNGGFGTGGGYGINSFGSFAGVNTFGSFAGVSSLGYNIRNGTVGTGYGSASGLYGQAYGADRSQTTVALQPLYSAITSLPGWSGTGGTHRVRHRVHHAQPSVPRTPTFDRDGKILWPSTIPTDPAASELRRAAEEAVRTVVRESSLTGHASIRPVIDAKNKLSALEHRILPEVKDKNITDGNALERFFFDLNSSLDAMTYVY
jgi:hypothetical protein